MAIWFTSDTHFFHNKNFVYEPRGFTSVEEMNKEIINRHNEVVKPEETVYILGDCGLNVESIEIIDCLNQLNGQKHLIIGNHDTNKRICDFIESGIFTGVAMGDRFTYKKIQFVLSHYPTLTANFEDPKPIWNIFGHLHSTEHFHNNLPHCFHVSMESNNCYPISLDEIIELIKKFNIKGEDVC